MRDEERHPPPAARLRGRPEARRCAHAPPAPASARPRARAARAPTKTPAIDDVLRRAASRTPTATQRREHDRPRRVGRHLEHLLELARRAPSTPASRGRGRARARRASRPSGASTARIPVRVRAAHRRDDREVVRRRRRRHRPLERAAEPRVAPGRRPASARDTTRFAAISSSPAASTNAPTVSARLYASQPSPARVGVDAPRHPEQARRCASGRTSASSRRTSARTTPCAQPSWYMRPVTFGNQ